MVKAPVLRVARPPLTIPMGFCASTAMAAGFLSQIRTATGSSDRISPWIDNGGLEI
jgi:hypothetical protein